MLIVKCRTVRPPRVSVVWIVSTGARQPGVAKSLMASGMIAIMVLLMGYNRFIGSTNMTIM